MSDRRAVALIARKRDGGELERDELQFLLSPAVGDEQLAALLMAVVWRGMTDRETEALLDAMLDSGERLSWPWPVADKHSTGGVGDKATLVVAPLVAACGGRIAKMSGRGLGHTGGTLDKLESIPGFRTALSVAEMRYAGSTASAYAVLRSVAGAGPGRRTLYAHPRRDRDHAQPAAGRHQRDVQEDRGRGEPAGARRQGGRGRVHARAAGGPRSWAR